MSGAPLRLSPPPDYTKVVFPLTLGVGIALIAFTLTRPTLPTVGDSQHSLPHGGWYRDGTKTVAYNSPHYYSSSFIPFLAVLGLTLLIYVSSLCSGRGATRSCPHCCGQH
uniref:TGB2 n=1 Tax=Pitaya virus X TaxID=1176736 RepID=A0A7T0NBU5_9VIRU|nr:TGB2 [Pitaya virus X]BDG58724.1 triple gene block protein 2 [Pitaya virus X]